MKKFKVGDIVWAIDDWYGYTSAANNWFGKVTTVYNSGRFDAETITSNIKVDKNYCFLEPEHFALSSHEEVQRSKGKHKLNPNENKIILTYMDGKQSMILIKNGRKVKADTTRLPYIKGEAVGEAAEKIYDTIVNNAKYYYGEETDD